MSMARATEKQAAGDLPGIDARERGSERSWGPQKACRELHGGLETALLLDLEAQAPRILRLVAVGSVVLTAKLQCARKLVVCLIYRLFPSRGAL